MGTIKIKITQTVETEKEIEVELPYYATRGIGIFVKVISADKCITANVYENINSYSIGVSTLPCGIGEYTPITEQQFNEKFELCKQKINL